MSRWMQARRRGVPRVSTPSLLAVALVLVIAVGLLDLASPRAATADEPSRFAMIGDYGLAGPGEAAVAALVNSWTPDYVVTAGDNNYPLGGADTIDENIGQYYQQYIGAYQGAYGPGATSNRFFPALGNHDWYSASGTPPNPDAYLDYFTLPGLAGNTSGNERYYDVRQGPVHLFILDSDPLEPDGISSTSTQAQWLQAQLGASDAPWKIVVLHHAPYSSGLHGSDTTLQWPFEAWGASAVVGAHDHHYERIEVGGIPYFVNGVGGASTRATNAPIAGSAVRFTGAFGAMLVEATDTNLTFRFYSVTNGGTLVDERTLVHQVAPTIGAVPLVDGTATVGAPVSFPMTVSDANGASDIEVAAAVITTTGGFSGSCMPVWSNGSLALLNDAASGWLIAGPVGLGGSAENSQCILDASTSSVSPSGTELQVTFGLTFKSGAAGANAVAPIVSDGSETVAEVAGFLTVGPPFRPTVLSASPSSGSISVGVPTLFTASVEDSDGASDLYWTALRVSRTGSGPSSCTIIYAFGSLYLFDDAGVNLLPAGAPGSGPGAANSQCALNAASSSVVTAGSRLDLTVSLTFFAVTQGSNQVIVAASDFVGAAPSVVFGSVEITP